MVLYNVTVKVERDIQNQWRQWMIQTHIPDVMSTATFSSYTMSKLLFQDDGDGETYVIQYRCADMETLNMYFSEHAPTLQQEHAVKFADKFVAFRTIMEVVDGGM